MARSLLAAALLAGAAAGCGRAADDEAEPAEVPTIVAQTADVTRRAMAEEISVRGTVTALPNGDVKVSALVPGRIVALTVAEGVAAIEAQAPAYAIIDMRLTDGNGLDVIARLKDRRPEARGVILTGYGNIATAVTAVKLGAYDYLAKPADADEIYAALVAQPGERAEPPENPMSADRVRWEHIQRVYELCGRNVSETARRLNMHRRTLQRILAKRAPR